MPITVAVLDANLLVPIVACDFLLTAFHLQLFEPIVSSTVLHEVERTLIEDFPHLEPNALLRRVEQMRAVLVGRTLETAAVERVPEAINGDDRHVVAAAIAGEATLIVTNDDALRPRSLPQAWTSNRSMGMRSSCAYGTRHPPTWAR